MPTKVFIKGIGSIKFPDGMTDEAIERAIHGNLKSAAPLAGAAALAGGSEEAEAGVITKGGRRMIEAWHGSPHTFDKFDISRIGTGEGAQAYGHGLYFADAEDVAREYRTGLAGFSTKDGEVIRPSWDDPAFMPLQELRKAEMNADAARKEVVRRANEMGWPEQIEVFDDLVARGVSDNAGSIYRAHIDVDPDMLLDYDKPLSEQPIIAEMLGVSPQNSTLTGGEYYSRLARMPGFVGDARRTQGVDGAYASSPIVSEKLREMGIPGLRYRDQASRNQAPQIPDYDTWLGYSKGGAIDTPELRREYASELEKAQRFEDEATYNYVMFDDKPISIQERGAATPGAMGATALGGLLAIPGMKATQETLLGLSGFGEAIGRGLAGTALGAGKFAMDSINPAMWAQSSPFTALLRNIDWGVDTATSGMQVSPERQAAMQAVAGQAGELWDRVPAPLQRAGEIYIEGLEPAARAAEYIGAEYGYPAVGQETGNALRTLEYLMP